MILRIPGKPIAKKRPKFFRKGNHVGTYSDQGTEEGKVMLLVNDQLRGHALIEGAVKFEAIFYMPIPKSTSKKKMAKMTNGKLLHTKKPDIDNLVKFIFDCLNGLAWKDDTQVVSLDVKKIYSDNPRTVIEISEIELLTEQVEIST